MEPGVFELVYMSDDVELTAEPPRFLKELSRVGVRAGGAGARPAAITRVRLEEWVRCFYETGAAVPVRSRGRTEAANEVGRAEELFVEGDRLLAVLRLEEEAAAWLRGGGATDAAVGIARGVAAPGGGSYRECIRYVAVAPAGGAVSGAAPNSRGGENDGGFDGQSRAGAQGRDPGRV
jgi:hypothetical protein